MKFFAVPRMPEGPPPSALVVGGAGAGTRAAETADTGTAGVGVAACGVASPPKKLRNPPNHDPLVAAGALVA